MQSPKSLVSRSLSAVQEAAVSTAFAFVALVAFLVSVSTSAVLIGFLIAAVSAGALGSASLLGAAPADLVLDRSGWAAAAASKDAVAPSSVLPISIQNRRESCVVRSCDLVCDVGVSIAESLIAGPVDVTGS